MSSQYSPNDSRLGLQTVTKEVQYLKHMERQFTKWAFGKDTRERNGRCMHWRIDNSIYKEKGPRRHFVPASVKQLFDS